MAAPWNLQKRATLRGSAVEIFVGGTGPFPIRLLYGRPASSPPRVHRHLTQLFRMTEPTRLAEIQRVELHLAYLFPLEYCMVVQRNSVPSKNKMNSSEPPLNPLRALQWWARPFCRRELTAVALRLFIICQSVTV